MTKGVDRQRVRKQYSVPDNLNARVALHEEYSTNDTDLHEWIFDRLDVPDDGRVLDVGAGPGHLWRTNLSRLPGGWSVVVTDASKGMVAESRDNLNGAPDFSFGIADAGGLPFDRNAFDVVVANHMLYHVPDRAAALREFRRVLSADGTLYTSTNGDGHMAEVDEVIADVTGEERERASETFSLENGAEQLGAVFENVELVRYPDSLRVPEPEPLVAYALSLPDVSQDHSEPIAERVRERMTDGDFEVTKETGMFVAES